MGLLPKETSANAYLPGDFSDRGHRRLRLSPGALLTKEIVVVFKPPPTFGPELRLRNGPSEMTVDAAVGTTSRQKRPSDTVDVLLTQMYVAYLARRWRATEKILGWRRATAALSGNFCSLG